MSKDIIIELKEALNDKDPVKRSKAIWELGNIGTQSEVPDLIELIYNDSDILVRVRATEALGRIISSENFEKKISHDKITNVEEVDLISYQERIDELLNLYYSQTIRDEKQLNLEQLIKIRELEPKRSFWSRYGLAMIITMISTALAIIISILSIFVK